MADGVYDASPVRDASFRGWDRAVFDAMAVPDFAGRMEAIRRHVRPRLEAIAADLAPRLTELAGEPLFAHVAQHARRTVNPPDETWCAWSPSPRGYKKQPHLQLGIRADRVFVQAGAIHEAPFRARLADLIRGERLDALRAALPPEAEWKDDHTAPSGVTTAALSEGDVERLAGGLRRKSRGDLVVALFWPRDVVLRMPGPAFLEKAVDGLARLLPVYRLAREAELAFAGRV